MKNRPASWIYGRLFFVSGFCETRIQEESSEIERDALKFGSIPDGGKDWLMKLAIGIPPVIQMSIIQHFLSIISISQIKVKKYNKIDISVIVCNLYRRDYSFTTFMMLI